MSAAPSLFDHLCAAPQNFEPATALRIARAEARARGLPLRITARPESALAPLAVEQVWVDDSAVHVSSHLFSYIGPLSPLPPGYIEIAATQRRRRAGGMAAFLDLFTDRLTGLFVAAAGKYDLAALLRWSRSGDNAILGALRALIGFGNAAPAVMPLPEDETLRFAGLLAQRTRNADGLRVMVQAELGLPVRLEQFRLVWRDIPDPERSRMGPGLQLGHNATAGAQVPDRAGQCRLVIGPVRYADFLSLEPGQPRLDRVIALARAYMPLGIGFDIQIVLDRRDIPETRLGGAGAPRLGWNTWARVAPAGQDSFDAIIRPPLSDGGADAVAA
ncbi:MAG: type VI secretion system baseplate subunit TssG [Paracoccus sp. (in: a-proteobacteria)]|uniref:type VI secretion system baseplate subunit TssG n=1 Tax=Paracoccus sp. TaxID=267 RepID=UPI0026DFD9B9|nr:type VI secretion system baseplate subunit TssG [Paracoccus sp. (in: a-proteobacteria)]MDO5611860.1 type VI secretion system baseplate subunit TssG [Paracoccus sp. (in: a-proteobacteria)]